MEEKKLKANRRKYKLKSILKVIFYVSIFLYLFSRMVPSILSNTKKTVFPVVEEIGDISKTGAIILRNEELYKSAGEGDIKYEVKEGERVPSGKFIAQLKLNGSDSTQNQQLEEIENKIKLLKEIKLEDGKNIDSLINQIVNEIQVKLQEGKYDQAEILKEKLSIYKGYRANNSEEIVDENLKKLEAERIKIQENINKNIANYYSKDAGIVSFEIDGYEEVYKYSDRRKYKYEDLKEKPMSKNMLDNKVSKNNEPIFKIINNYQWYMIIDGSRIKDVDKLKKGSNLKVSYKGKEVIGQIDTVQKEKDKVTLLCNFNTNFEDFYNERFIDLDIIRYTYTGYKIPKKAIIEEGKEKGVYIKDVNDIARFRPINILYENNENVYIDMGDENGNITLGPKDELSRTVRRYDEIILSSRGIKEGTILR